MTEPVLLDSGPLGQLAHPRPKQEIAVWLESLASAGVRVIVPEGADYEVRRNLLLEGRTTSLARLNALKSRLDYLPITTSVVLKAAELWADARRRGKPSADPKELDFDVILAAQALQAKGIVATENVGHLSRYVTAVNWRLIVPT